MSTPEQEAREEIDRLLLAAGWVIQDLKDTNLGASLGVAVREFPLSTGEADYLLFVDRRACGVIEAKKKGKTLGGVAEQSARYTVGLPKGVPHVAEPLPFAYESTGVETFFRDLRDPEPKSRRVFSFHRPETLLEWAGQPDTFRNRLKTMPPLPLEGLRGCQVEAIHSLEISMAADRPRALIQMATGSGKTYTAVSTIYRLVKHAGARRVLFLVDRSNLGRQTLKEFQQFTTPDDGRKFTELYNVQHLTSNKLDPVCRVTICTIQRLYSMLAGKEIDPELEEHSGFDTAPADFEPEPIGYNPALPVETFDVIITDECHRSIYNLWRQVLEYFDAHLVGLTATPSKQTLGFFNRNLVMEYSHERAVADGVNVGFDVYRIETKLTKDGGKVEAGHYVDKRDRQTRAVRWEQLDEEIVYGATDLDRSVVVPDQIRKVVRTFRDRLFTEIFPGRTEVPKTLVFAKDDSHAEDIVQIIRDEFGRGNDFCKKITYKTTGERPEDLIQQFRNSYNPRIVVTVDMISTGTDIRPLECLLFMRDVKSRVYFDQMKGRATRVINDADFKQVTPDAGTKTHFVLVDAVGVCESDKGDARPLERKPTVSFDKLLQSVALGQRDADTLSSLAGRLARLDRELDPAQREKLEKVAGGQALKTIINRLLGAIDPDAQISNACKKHGVEVPTPGQIKAEADALAQQACLPFDNAGFRNLLVETKRQNEQIIDTVSEDELVYAGPDPKANEKAQSLVASFKQFIEQHKDELTALQILYSRPYGQQSLTFEAVKQLAETLNDTTPRFTAESLWQAFQQLDQPHVRRLGPQRLLTNVIALVRFALKQQPVLEPFTDTVEARFERWLTERQQHGRTFTDEQRLWLTMIKDHVAASVRIELDDFEARPFSDRGGTIKAMRLFGEELPTLVDELNGALVA